MMGPPKDPETPQEWQEAVNAADVLLRMHGGQPYGLAHELPIVYVRRCEQILDEGRERGIVPRAPQG